MTSRLLGLRFVQVGSYDKMTCSCLQITPLCARGHIAGSFIFCLDGTESIFEENLAVCKRFLEWGEEIEPGGMNPYKQSLCDTNVQINL